jgi:hypothetical protein
MMASVCAAILAVSLSEVLESVRQSSVVEVPGCWLLPWFSRDALEATVEVFSKAEIILCSGWPLKAFIAR